jgi:hypothetical protein
MGDQRLCAGNKCAHPACAGVKRLPGQVACADEMRFALLSLGCCYRGATTLITTLVHTTSSDWQRAQFDKYITGVEQGQKTAKTQPQPLDTADRNKRVIDTMRLYSDCSKADIFSSNALKDEPTLAQFIGKPFSDAGLLSPALGVECACVVLFD